MPNPSIVLASLDDEKLRQSITNLVAHVKRATHTMLTDTNSTVDAMEKKLKSLGNIKIDSGGSVDGGVSKHTKAQNANTEAIEKNIAAQDRQIKQNQEAAMSFDQIAAALDKARRTVSEFNTSRASGILPSSEDYKRYEQALARIVEYNDNLKQSALSRADANQWANVFDARRNVKDLFSTDERLKQLNKYYAEQEKLSQKATQDEERQRQKRVAAMEKESAAQKKMIDDQYKLSFARTMKIPTDQLDLAQAKLERLQALLRDMRERGILSNTQIASTEAEIRKLEQIIGQVNTAQQQTTQSAQRYTEEVRKQAAAIRATKTWQEQGVANVNGHVFYDAERVRGTKQLKREIGTLEEQILRSMQQQSIAERDNTQEAQRRLDTIKGIAAAARAEMKQYGTSGYNTGYAVQNPYIYAENDARAKGLTIEQQIANILRENEASYQASARSAAMVVEEEKKITQEQDKRKSYKAPVTTFEGTFKQLTGNALGIQPSEIDSTSTKIAKMTAYLRQLETAYSNLRAQEMSSPFGKQLREEIQMTSRQIQRLRSEISRPINLQAALSGSEKTLDDIAYKIQQLQSYKRGIDLTDPKQVAELKQVDSEINRLQKDLNKYMSTTKQATEMNKALARSWNYMKNRLAFYFSVGASTQFIKSLIEVRSQYELNERALGILIGSAERGTQIFNELSQMALVSPYTLIELSSAAKQLTAYDVAARDVVDTTRRLADMASAVGVPMERLTYALGQIKAYGYLNSRDNRMFANAGIPLVKQLADYYTELEGRMVSTADVYDRIKKKAVDYNTVMQVIYRMTDEGGKFFDFQAKMADTLKVRLANLTLAWNNMLNDMGKETQGVLTWGIGALRTLFLHWKELDKLIKNVAWVVGMRTAFMLLAYGALKLGGALGVTTKQMALSAVFGNRLAGVLRTVGGAMKTLAMSKVTWFLVLAEAVWEAGNMIFRANQATVELNKSLREGAETNFKDISDYLAQYQKVADSLYGGKSSNAYELQSGQYKTGEISTPTNINVDEANKAWEAMRERIELSTAASDDFVGRLLTIENVSERLRQGFILLNDIQQVNSAMKEMGDTAIVVTQDWSKWWNLWAGTDGLIDNLGDVKDELDDVVKKFGSLEEARKQATGTNEAWEEVSDYDNAMRTLKGDIDETTESLNNFIRNMGFASNPDQIAEVYAQALQKISAEGNLDPQRGYMLQKGFEDARGKAMKEALEARIADEEHALKLARDYETKASLSASKQRHEAQLELFTKYTNDQRTEWERFTKYMKENHISEMQAMFGQMDEEQISHINWQEDKYLGFVKRTAAAYAKRHNMAYEDVFNRLWGLIKETNLMQIFLKLTISTEGQQSITDLLAEYDQQADAALTKIQRNQRRLQEMVAMGWNSAISNHYKEYLQLKRETDDLIANYNDVTSKEKGGHAKQADKAAADAAKARRKQEAEARKAAREAAKAQREGETELQKAIKDSLQIIERERRSFDEMTKSGVSRIKAIERATSGFSDTVKNINAVLGKYGIPLFDPKVFAGSDDPHAVLSYLEDVLNNVKMSKFVKPEDIKMLDLKINEIKVDVAKYDSDKITKGLNNELNKLSEEYELSLAFDADPDLGNIFADMFQIGIDSLPNNFGELVERANAEIKKALEKKGVDTNKVFFDIMSSNILDNEKDVAEGIYGLATRIGETEESEFIKTLIGFQNKFKENYKKIISDNNKMLEDLVKKYGNYTDKVAEIESDKIERIKKLNDEFYNDELRKRPEYAARLAAINNDAEKELTNALFDEFKNSRLYIAMFENIEYAATSTLEAISNELDGLKSELKELSPEQLKTIYTQYEKIQKELLRRNPFKNLIKNAKAYTKAVGKSGKAAQKDFVQTKEKYEKQRDYVALLKVQLEKLKATQPQNKIAIDTLSDQVKIEDEKLKKLTAEYELAQKLNDQYNMMRIVFGDQSAAITKIIQIVAQNLESLSDFRDTLNNLFGIDADKGETLFGHTLDAVIDDLSDVGKSLNNIVSSAQSMNVVGVATGAVGVVTGIGDAVASLFGDGKKRTKRINREIVKSQEEVRKLEMAYKELERAIDRENGKEETRARREQIANKEAQLAEIERQKALEESKRKKDRDNDAIKSYEENAQDLRHEIEDLKKGVVDDLFGTEVKSAADEFVDAWVDAWKAGEKTLDAMKEKMNDMMITLVKNAISSRIVQNLLQPVYDKVDEFTEDKSDGSYDLTQAELTALANLSSTTGEKIDTALTSFYKNLERLGITAKEIEENKELSALQAGISGITEEQASALEAYWNINTQEQFKHTTLLTQIRDLLSGPSGDVQIGVQAQMLLQLQQSYQVQMSIHSTLQGWTNPSGQAVRVELIS